ncbi:MAG: P-II family nitrogen regulator [Methanosarcinales archaeon]
MKEVIAIIRRHKIQETKAGLLGIGIPALTMYSVDGRGKQQGLHCFADRSSTSLDFVWKVYELDPGLSEIMPEDVQNLNYIPKRMISVIVDDLDVPRVVETLIRINQTGNVGDGKIFVVPVEDAIRIRTGEKGDIALS